MSRTGSNPPWSITREVKVSVFYISCVNNTFSIGKGHVGPQTTLKNSNMNGGKVPSAASEGRRLTERVKRAIEAATLKYEDKMEQSPEL